MDHPQAPRVDLTKFERAIASVLSRGSYLAGMEAYVRRLVNANADPLCVPQVALEAMSCHPTIYLAERIVTGVIRRPDLYSIRHHDKRIVAETEEWLWPLLPDLCASAARAFSYGTVPVILDWGREELVTYAPGRNGKPRKRTVEGHTHYTAAHEVRWAEVDLRVRNDKLQELDYYGTTYDASRAHVFVWDAEFGSWLGKSARRRSWRDYCVATILEQLECAYLERSVDSPRVAYAPAGSFEVDGESFSTAEYVAQLLNELKGGGAAVFPDSRDSNGNRLYEVEAFDLPDRSAVWGAAIGRREQRMLLSYLALVGSDLSAGSAKTLDGLLKEFVQDLAEWVAQNLTAIVETVHAANHDPSKIRAPEVIATDVGKARVQKSLAEVLRMVDSGKVSSHVDVATALDRLGIPIMESPEDSSVDPQGDPDPAVPSFTGRPGRPRDLFGDRDQRREDARTVEGETDTGQRDGREGENLSSGPAVPSFGALTVNVVNPPTTIQNNIPAPELHMSEAPSVNVEVNVPEQPAPVVNVPAPQINVEPPSVSLEAPQVSVNVEAPNVQVEPRINVEAPEVNVEVNPELSLPKRRIHFNRDNTGRIRDAEVGED